MGMTRLLSKPASIFQLETLRTSKSIRLNSARDLVTSTTSHSPPAKISAPDGGTHCLRLLVYTSGNPISQKVKDYVQYMGDLLSWPHSDCQHIEQAGTTLGALIKDAAQNFDLVTFWEPPRSPIKRRFSALAVQWAIDYMPASLLVARKPCWPLQKLLLVASNEEMNEEVTRWAVRLAQASGARVTLLIIVSHASLGRQQVTQLPQGLTIASATDTVLEKQIRQMVGQLEAEGIETSLQLRSGSLDQQIHDEVTQEEYDLIIAAAESDNPWMRHLQAEILSSLLRWASRSILIVKSSH